MADTKLSELLPILSSQPDDVQMSADDPAEEAPPPLVEATAVDSSAATTQAGDESGDKVAAVSAPKPAASTQLTAETEPAATSRGATSTGVTSRGVTKPKPAASVQPATRTVPLVTQTAKTVSTPKPRSPKTRPQAVETAPRDNVEIPAARTSQRQAPIRNEITVVEVPVARTTSQTATQTSPPASRRPMPIRNEISVVEIPPPPRLRETSRPSDGHVSQVFGQQSPDTRIVIRATQESWVQVRNRNDVPLITRVLRAGDTYYVPNRDGLTLVTGNAGGLQIEVDSVRLPWLGSVGTDRREIALDPTRLLAGTAVAQ